MEQFLYNFKDLGIAGISVAALAFVAYQLIKQLGEARTNYQGYVEDNNHTVTELVKEATITMTEVRNSIESHNEVLKLLAERLNK